MMKSYYHINSIAVVDSSKYYTHKRNQQQTIIMHSNKDKRDLYILSHLSVFSFVIYK